MTFSCVTLGCKTNQTDTDRLIGQLISRGHTYLPWGEPVCAIIINTCSVTATGDKKSRAVINRAHREFPDAIIAVHGCMGQGLTQKPPNIDILGGTGDKAKFIEELERAVGCDNPESPTLNSQLSTFNSSRTRAFLKIQDGCSNSCSYCIIPSLRGQSRSVAFEDVMDGARAYADSGVKEIVLTGIEISAYNEGLAPLETALADAFPAVRFRLGSLDPSCVTYVFTKTLSKHKNICPHFHLALQSGCDKTLAAMDRNYDTVIAAEAVKHLCGAFDCTLGCDLIVGFPGESEEDFKESLDFIKRMGFTFTHIFPFSVRPGTKAAALPGHLTNAIKRERARRAALSTDRLFAESAARQTELDVLFETERDGESFGHADNYFEVRVKEIGLHNEIRRVKILEVNEKTLYGGLL